MTDSAVKYISLGEWFDLGTEVELVDDYRNSELAKPYNSGLFLGYRNGKLDEENCNFDEFEIRPRSSTDRTEHF